MSLNKANLRDLIAATSLEILLDIGFKSSIFRSMWPSNLMDDLEKQLDRTPLLYYIKLCASCQTHWWIQTGVTVQKHSIWLKISHIGPLWPWNLTDDLKNNRVPLEPLLCYFKILASFHSHLWIQSGVTVRKIPIWVKINNFLALWLSNLVDDLEKQ